MKILTAKCVNGRREMPDGAVHDGDTVTVLVPENGDDVSDLADHEVARLQEAIAEADRGEGIDGWRLLEELKG